MTDLVIVSMHEKGFPMADFYHGYGKTDPLEFERISPSPDGFFTMKRGDTLADAFAKARKEWPDAIIEIAAGEEDEDGEEHD